MGFDFLDFGFPKSGTDWKSINGKPFITVSAKGRSNGLSTKINDGADFGPDTTLNANSPYQTGPPYTQTSGIQEAYNYVQPDNNQPTRIQLSEGYFPIASTIVPSSNTILQGAEFNSTYLYPITNGINIIEGGISQSVFEDFGIISGSKNPAEALWGIDLSQTETTPHNIVQRIILNGTFTGGGINMDGNEDSYVDKVITIGFNGPTSLSWNVPSGNINVIESVLYAPVSAIISYQTASIINCDLNTLKLNGTCTSLSLINNYINSTILDLNGQNPGTIIVEGGIVTNANPIFKNSGASGTISNLEMNTWFSNPSGTVWTGTGVSINKAKIRGISLYNGNATISGAPFSVVSGIILPLGFSATTPTLPTGTGSANKIMNVNPFPVRIYQEISSLTSNGTHIIDASGNDIALPDDPVEFTLDVYASVYYATAVPTSWKWYGTM